MSTTVTQQIEQLGVFPIIVIEDARDALQLGETLLAAGLPCAEVTFRTAAAEEAIRSLAEGFPELLVGAGTVLSVEQAQQAIDAGATFILSPGFNPEVVDFCLSQEVAIYPGIATPTEIEAAMAKGLKVLKFFPAASMGGLQYLKAISAPLSMVRYIPTGGVNLQNLPDYLNFDKVLACAGTWIVKKQWLIDRDFDRIRKEAEDAVAVVKKLRGE
jgi:2-dehydro-3-deoxyphosphogluconate aldolase/(4S)-4-hydroxy-2-oxoglutarate aldolase